MRENKVKKKIAEGGTSLGTFVFEFNTTGIGRLAAEAGAEFVVYDLEHTGWSFETVRLLMATTPAERIAPFVRVPATEYHFIARTLDMGAMGVMVPRVESEAQARRIVDSARYPPLGRRGAAFGVAHDDYTAGDVGKKTGSANRESLLIAQIETTGGIDAAGEIAATDGIDVLWIGQFDLTSSMGIPGQFSHPRFARAVECVLEAARKHGKTAGYMASNVEEANSLLKRGFRILAYGGDLWLYQEALRAGLHAVRHRP